MTAALAAAAAAYVLESVGKQKQATKMSCAALIIRSDLHTQSFWREEENAEDARRLKQNGLIFLGSKKERTQ